MPTPRERLHHPARVVAAIALAVVVLRLPLLGAPLSPDEAGFLTVAAHWSPGGGSLYGHFWVDRPPLLLFLFGSVAEAGSLGVRLLGCLAAAVTVLLVAATMRRTLGTRAALWAALVAAALQVAPTFGAWETNGELLAAPFVAAGVYATASAIQAVTTSDRSTRQTALLAAVAGAAAVAAVLIKQNMVDVFIFAAPALAVTLHRRQLSWRTAARGFGWAMLGAGVVLTVVMGAAALMGTSADGVFYAAYPFRVAAGQVIAHGSLTGRITRLSHLGLRVLTSMTPLVVGGLLVMLVARRRSSQAIDSPTPWLAAGLLAQVGFATVSVLAGGSFWSHYLVELVVPLALISGLVASRATRWTVTVVAVPVLASALAWAAGFGLTGDVSGHQVGVAIREVAQPGDSIVSLLGSPETVASSGLSTPTPYLWSLPQRVLDPQFTQLGGLLRGSSAPTWVVVRNHQTKDELQPTGAGRALHRRYREVGSVCGREIYLRNNVRRATPLDDDPCREPLSRLG